MKRQDSDQEKKRQEANSFLQFFIIHGLINSNYRRSVISKTRTLTRLIAFAFAFVIANLFLSTKSFSQVVVVNPTSPFTVPSGVSSIKVEVWGGGGGGGGLTAGLGTNGGGGGGGGAYNVATFTVAPGHTFTITRGTGGNGGAGNANGVAGGTTTVTGTDGTISANGGGGGGRGNFGNGTAGTAGAGGFNSGGAGGASSGNGAGGGGGAGNATPTGTGNGGAGSNTAAGTAGLGSPNAAPYIGGAGAPAVTANGNGTTGNAPGGGGSGGRNSGLGSSNGGAGGAGQIVITYTPCAPPAAPTITSPINYCQNSTSSPLTATGSNLLWYTSATGGTGSSTAPTPLTTSLGTTSYFVSQHTDPTAGCESPRAEIVVNVTAPPTSTFTKNDVQCFNTNTGQIVITAVGGTAPYTYSIDNGATYPNNDGTFNGLGAGTYRIRIKDSLGCESKSVQ